MATCGTALTPQQAQLLRRFVSKVVLSFDTGRTDFSGAPPGWHKGGDYPVAWYQHFGQGRTFYTSLGHRSDLWTGDALFRSHVTGAIRWVFKLDS